MNLVLKSLSAITLSLCAAAAFSQPEFLTTHNNTEFESNAYVSGYIPSPYPTSAHSTREIRWNMVRMACFGHTTDNKCPALVILGPNTATPIELGYLTLDLNTGEITPKQLSNKGYTITVNGLGESTINKD